MADRILKSSHILMFPFVFTQDVKTVNEMLLSEKLWEHKEFDVGESTENYNEFIYFYEYVRKALLSSSSVKDTQTSYYFEYVIKKGKYTLEVHNKKYTLDIDGISMRTFNTQVGILSIELLNYDYIKSEDILIINDFSRRLYPQFLGGKDNLEYITNTLLPQSVTLHLDKDIYEDFSYYKDMEKIRKDATNLPSFIHDLLGDGFSSHIKTKKIHIEPIIDDRMFVISMYMNDALAEKLKAYDEKKDVYAYENDDYWYKYIFVDTKAKMCQSKHMTKQLIRGSTYDRWVEWGTLFGISRYSFVALSTKSFGNDILKTHMHTMYFQIFTLLLAYRASMLNFSRRVSEVIVDDLSLPKLQETVKNIYRDYINFENNLFFREVTAQEQGIEIYNQALNVMQIEKHIKDLDSEIEELHTYVSMRNEENRNNRLETISKIGAIFLPPTVISGILGVNTIDFAKDSMTMYISGGLVILSALFGMGSISRSKILKVISAVLLAGTVAYALFCMPQQQTPSKKGENICHKTH